MLQVEKSGTLGCNNDQTIFQVSSVICMATQQGGAEIRCDDKAPTLTAAAGMSGNNQPVICLCMATGQTGAEITENIAPTLNCNHEQPIICLTFPEDVANTLLGKSQLSHRLDEDTLVLAFKAGNGAKVRGLGIQNGVSPTLTSAESGTNQVPVVLAVDCRNGCVDPEINGTLQAKPNGGQSLNMNNVVLVAVPREATSFDLAQVTSKTNQSKGSVGVAYSLAKTGQPAVITATEEGTILVDGKPCVLVKLLVRRLTPLECERLQGYPDGWTVLPPIEDMSEYEYDFWRRFLLEKAEREGKKAPQKTKEQMVAWYNRSFCKDTDSARYKAMGNSIALPQWKWVLKRLCGCYERDATMASLFDGIGGFPLLWEQLNGKGSCLWASEIEPFPVAVTRYRFGGGDARGNEV